MDLGIYPPELVRGSSGCNVWLLIFQEVAVMHNIDDAVNAYLTRNCMGRQKAAKAKFLAEEFGCSLREVNAVVRQLRQNGKLIGSAKEKPYGYYVPSTDKEREEYLSSFKSELFDMFKTYRAQTLAKHNYLDSRSQPELFKNSMSGHPSPFLTNHNKDEQIGVGEIVEIGDKPFVAVHFNESANAKKILNMKINPVF